MTTTVESAVDYGLVKVLRERTGQVLQQRRRALEVGDRQLSDADLRALSLDIIADELQALSAERINSGQVPVSLDEEEWLTTAVAAALHGAGRLQPWLENLDVENIDANGFDEVFVSFADGSQEKVGPIAESDADMIEQIRVLAATSGLSSRPFDAANPQLDLRLPDGSRLSAVMSVAHRPGLSVRRKRLRVARLSDLRANGTLTPEIVAFLTAAVRARLNIMIAGEVNAGKTTLLQAVANEIDPRERLITIERSLELGLHELTDLHPNVLALEERLANAEGQGYVSMADLVRRSLRSNPQRVIVGEVLGDEVVAMLNAMSQGNDGSLSTIHANSSADVFQKISTYAIQAVERMPIDASQLLVANALKLVVFVDRDLDPTTGLQRRRVTSIREVSGYADGRVASSEIYALDENDNVVPSAPLTDRTRARLARQGFEVGSFDFPGRW
ncbi:ATPase, T2SS/T4P/T4SS family [Kitasatospora sp. NPDC085879]|uniref:CpaF family protein n=1 Tax=Kitasatospora sp. NPDC085879 TaxID=3154769 RepID=UPI00344335C3